MKPDAHVPADLRQWVVERLPGVATITDVSWPRGDSRVWRVATDSAAAFVKLSPSPANYTREVRGFEYAARALATHEAPRLLAADPDLLAIMSSPLPGRIVRGLSLDVAEEQRVHERAGQLLRRWHDHSGPISAPVRDAIMASVADQAAEAAACVDRAGEHLTQGQRALVRRVCRELPELAEELPLVDRHGDYATRNWLWGHDLGLIDFEQFAPGIAAEELVWLSAALWSTRSDLKSAFLSGYGPLSEAEQQALPLFAARLAVSYFTTGITKQEPALVERGQFVLTRLAHN